MKLIRDYKIDGDFTTQFDKVLGFYIGFYFIQTPFIDIERKLITFDLLKDKAFQNGDEKDGLMLLRVFLM